MYVHNNYTHTHILIHVYNIVYTCQQLEFQPLPFIQIISAVNFILWYGPPHPVLAISADCLGNAIAR